MTGAAGRHTIETRTATVADAELLADLGARAFSDTFLASTTPLDMAAYLTGAFGPDVQAAEIGDSARTFLIAEVDGETAGYAQLKRGAAPRCVVASRPIEIVRFYADAHWIGRGVGAALMQAGLRLATDEGRDVVWLDVWEHNDRAIAFYRRWGFAPVGAATFAIGDDVQSDLVMARYTEAASPSR